MSGPTWVHSKTSFRHKTTYENFQPYQSNCQLWGCAPFLENHILANMQFLQNVSRHYMLFQCKPFTANGNDTILRKSLISLFLGQILAKPFTATKSNYKFVRKKSIFGPFSSLFWPNEQTRILPKIIKMKWNWKLEEEIHFLIQKFLTSLIQWTMKKTFPFS